MTNGNTSQSSDPSSILIVPNDKTQGKKKVCILPDLNSTLQNHDNDKESCSYDDCCQFMGKILYNYKVVLSLDVPTSLIICAKVNMHMQGT